MKLINFIICDDIRSEIGNKLSLMGVYSESINFHSKANDENQWPKTKRIALYIQMDVEEDEDLNDIQSFELQIDYNGEVKNIGGSDSPPPKSEAEKGLLLQAIFDKFKFKETGKIIFIIKFFDKNGNKLSEVSSPVPLKVEETIHQ